MTKAVVEGKGSVTAAFDTAANGGTLSTMIGPLETLPAISPTTERCSRCIKPAVYFRREHDQIHYACSEHAPPLHAWKTVEGIELGANKILAGVSQALDLGARVRARARAAAKKKPSSKT